MQFKLISHFYLYKKIKNKKKKTPESITDALFSWFSIFARIINKISGKNDYDTDLCVFVIKQDLTD